MSDDNVAGLRRPGFIEDPLTALLGRGAKRLIQQAVEGELGELLAGFEGQTDSAGRAAVVRNGYLPEREVLTGVGPVRVRVPKVRSRTGESVAFRSSLVPPDVRRAKAVEAALPWLYLKGLSSGPMQAALEVLVGPEAKGLSASVISRLKLQWQEEYDTWRQQPLDEDRWVYLWADGIYSGLRAEGQRLCTLVVIGVNDRGEKRFLVIEDGVRESTQSWREVLLGLKARGLERPPELAVVTAPWASGPHWSKYSLSRGINAAGCIRQPTCATTCLSRCRPRRRPRCMRSGWHPRVSALTRRSSSS